MALCAAVTANTEDAVAGMGGFFGVALSFLMLLNWYFGV
jgi:hypothetical protein